MELGTSVDENRVLKKRDYVRVVNTQDEWEELIGRVEEFMAPVIEGEIRESFREGDKIVVLFPMSREEVHRARLTGVNCYHGIVKHHLRINEGKQVFNRDQVEWLDPDDI